MGRLISNYLNYMEQPDLIKCMSTNGLLLPKYADRLAELGVNSVTVTINAIDPDIAVDIYSFIKYEGKVYKDYEAVEILIKNQLDGVEKAAANGMVVKVNSVLMSLRTKVKFLKLLILIFLSQ